MENMYWVGGIIVTYIILWFLMDILITRPRREKEQIIQAEKDKIAQGFWQCNECDEYVGPALTTCPFCGTAKN